MPYYMLRERTFTLNYCAHQILVSFCGQQTVGFEVQVSS